MPPAFYAYQWQIIRLSTIQPAFDLLLHSMPMNDKTSQLIAVLQGATAELLWISETDAPLQVIYWQEEQAKELTNERLLELTHHSSETPIETLNLDNFFSAATVEQDWFGDEEKATASKYRALVAMLKQNLRDLKVYRVGEVTIDIYILGQMSAGDLVGIATQAVET